MASCTSEKRHSVSGSSGSAEMVLRNNDLLVKILACLPTKTVLGLRAVNKHWHSLIFSPEFGRIHLCHNFKFSLSGLLVYDTSSSNNGSSKSIIFDPDGHPMSCCSYIFPQHGNVLESCNGLILYYSGGFYVGNPTTKQSALLPSHGGVKCGSRFALSLAFDPSLSPYYKVIYVWWSESSLKFHSRVYSSKSCCWEPSDYIACPSINDIADQHPLDYGAYGSTSGSRCFSRAVYCNGALHWMYGRRHLVYYKVSEDCVGVVKLPPRGSMEMRRIKSECTVFAAAQNNLVFIDRMYHYNSNPLIVVYELDKDYWGFTGNYLVDLEQVLSPFPDLNPSDYLLVSAFQGAEEGDVVMVAWITGTLIVHHTKDNSSQVLLQLCNSANERPKQPNTVLPYMESLCPV